MTDRPVIEARNLTVSYLLGHGLLAGKTRLNAVDNVSLTIGRGSFFGLVGESGSGKTTLGRALLHAAPITEGEVVYQDDEVRYDLRTMSNTELKDYRKRAQLIFQDPYAALSPRMTVRDIIAEPLEVMGLTKTREETDARVREIAANCRLNLEHLRRFPHAFSGGQRQRISIARALVLKPRVILLDEPTSALDMSVQAQVVDLLRTLQARHNLAYLFISHDLKVVRALSHRILVMKDGKVVEAGTRDEIFAQPKEAYTRELIAAAFDETMLKAG